MWSLWEHEVYTRPAQLIIIGAGLTGTTSAILYKQRFPEDRVCVVERGSMPAGASTRNAGFACFGSPSELLDDWDKDGHDAMLQRVDMRWRGLARWREIIPEKQMDYLKTGGWEVFPKSDEQVLKDLEEKLESLNQTLLPVVGSTVFEVDTEISRFGFNLHSRGFYNPFEGQLHPGKLCKALENMARQAGVEFAFGVDVQSVEHLNGEMSVTDTYGRVRMAERVLVACNGLAADLAPELNVVPARGQVVVTSPLTKSPFSGIFHLESGYWYFRNVGNRVLLGGGRHLNIQGERTASQSTDEPIQSALEEMLRTRILPGMDFRIDYRWAGTMGFGLGNEKTPLVAALSEQLYVAARLGGMGVAMAPVVADQAVHLLT